MTNLFQKIEAMKLRILHEDDKISLFPYGGDSYDFSEENFEKALREFSLELLEEVGRELEDCLTIDQLDAKDPLTQFIARSMGDAMQRQILHKLQALKDSLNKEE